MVRHDAERDILAADKLHKVRLSEAIVITDDANLVTIGEVRLSLAEVTNDCPSRAGGAGSGVSRKSVVEVDGKTLKRIDIEAAGILSSLELCPRTLVHDNDRILSVVSESAERFSNNTNRRSAGNNTDTDSGGSRRSRQSNDLRKQLFLCLFRDLIGQLVIDVVKELLTAEVISLVTNFALC